MFAETVHCFERFGDRAPSQDLHPQRGAQLRHHRRGFDPVADHVADDENQPILQGDRIKPVAAGRCVLRGDEVLCGHVGTGNDGHRRGQQRLLHHGGGIADVTVTLR